MTNLIDKMHGVTGLSSATDALLGKVADAITSVEVRNPNPDNWMDRHGKLAIKAGSRDELVKTLTALGVFTVSADSAIALIASGHRLPMAEIDAALSKYKVELRDRIALKVAAERFGLLKK